METNPQKAYPYYMSAMQRGHGAAALKCALKSQNQANYQQAFKEFSMAAKVNIPQAQHKVAEYYAEGKGIEKDISEAKAWYQISINSDKEEAEKSGNKI